MNQHERAGVSIAKCPSCEGVFLRGVDRGMLIEQENEWHVSSGPSTQPIPRITPGMTAPSAIMQTHEARSFVDELFG
jgi:Zn-finger nucleic acid-binding protein